MQAHSSNTAIQQYPPPQADVPSRRNGFMRRMGVLALAVATATGASLVFSLNAFAYGPDSPPSAADARKQWNDLRLVDNLKPKTSIRPQTAL